MAQSEKRVVYYTDMSEDFAGNDINTKKIDASFKYVNDSPFWRAAAFLLYYLLGLAVGWFCIRIMNGTKFINSRAARRIKGGFFLYGNHTHWTDAFLAHIVTAPKRTYMIANADAVSIRGLKNIVLMLGAIPVPTGIKQIKRFTETVNRRCREGGCVAIYPEANTWPYYTGLRPFTTTSFTYPAELKVPVVAMATTFCRRKGLLKFIKTPARTVTVSEPFCAPPEMSRQEAKEYLYKQVYAFIKRHVDAEDNYEYIRYEERADIGETL